MIQMCTKVKQECTLWNVSPSLQIIDIILKVLNIKLYHKYYINLTWSKKIMSRSYKPKEKNMYTLQSFNSIH